MQMKYALFLLLFSSCSQFRTSELSDTSREYPEWIYSPYAVCAEAQELCASGEGKGQAAADIQAKKNLASVFEVKISSEFSALTSSSSSIPWQAEVHQEIQTSLNESVDQVLEVVQIIHRFKKDKLNFSLASLDRAKASELIRSRIEKLDDELTILWNKKQRTLLRRMIRLSLEREKLNDRYSIIRGDRIPARIGLKEVLEWKASRLKLSPLNLKVGLAPEWMTEKIKELLTEAGFRLSKAEVDKVLTLHVDSIKEYLNVNGFEKYTFTLKLTSIENGEKKKVISTSETVTGRTQGDALLKVKPFFTEYLEQNLSELDLD